jgi:glutamate dehydrogenase (NAD(P)+)
VNAGGVTVSYFEWVQNFENQAWGLDDINLRLRHKMNRAVDAVVECWRQLRAKTDRQDQRGAAVDLRTAALVVAVRRVAKATLQRGIWP